MRLINNFIFVFIKFIVFIVILLNSCKKEDETAIEIGRSYEGGIIFYIDNTGQHGLVAAPNDQNFSSQWGCVTTDIPGAIGTSIGTGNQNTVAIVNNCPDTNSAAFICANLELNGFSDWYLPSIDELNSMYQNLHLKGLGKFKEQFCFFDCYDAYYWSSSQYDNLCAWNLNFKLGFKTSGFSKNNGGYVRAIRAF